MADLLATGLAWLDAQRERFLTRTVTYRRGSLGLIVPATIGRTAFRLDIGMGVTERIESRDYLISASALAAIGIPQRGDRIVETIGSRRHTAEVLAPGREPHWRWTDPDRRTYRIHTTHITTEDL